MNFQNNTKVTYTNQLSGQSQGFPMMYQNSTKVTPLNQQWTSMDQGYGSLLMTPPATPTISPTQHQINSYFMAPPATPTISPTQHQYNSNFMGNSPILKDTKMVMGNIASPYMVKPEIKTEIKTEFKNDPGLKSEFGEADYNSDLNESFSELNVDSDYNTEDEYEADSGRRTGYAFGGPTHTFQWMPDCNCFQPGEMEPDCGPIYGHLGEFPSGKLYF